MRDWIITDIDGVLVNTGEANIQAFREGFRLGGMNVPSRMQTRRMIGTDPIKAMLSWGCPSSRQARNAYASFIVPVYLSLIRSQRNLLYPGVANTLSKLTASGFWIAACTSGYRRVQLEVLKTAGIARFISLLTTTEKSRYSRSDPRFYRNLLAKMTGRPLCYVDDMGGNLDVAHSLGLRTVYAAYGFGKSPSKKPDYEISNFAQLIYVVKSVLKQGDLKFSSRPSGMDCEKTVT